MKKLGLLFKETSENRIKNHIKESSAVLVIQYSGISSPDLCNLRKSLRGSNSSLFVVKNSVALRALQGAGLECLVKAIEGACGLVFVKDDPVAPSRVVCDFIKEHEKLQLQGGVVNEKLLSKKDVEALARLPAKEVLRAQVVGALQAPISSLVIALNQIIAKFVYCLDQIKQKKTT